MTFAFYSLNVTFFRIPAGEPAGALQTVPWCKEATRESETAYLK